MSSLLVCYYKLIFVKSQTILKQSVKYRKRVKDTDIGNTLQSQINDLKLLLNAYIDGDLK